MNLSRAIDSRLAEQARTFEVVAWIAVVVLALNFLALLRVLTLIEPVTAAFAHGAWEGLGPAIAPVGRRLVELMPVFFYLGGVISLARMFGRVANGELLSRTNAAGLADVGSSLMWGAAAGAVMVPWIQSWIDRDYGFGGLDLTLETAILFVIGGALMVLGRIMTHATGLQTELDSNV
ncbi:MAG: hypothetical protein ACOY4K_07465 [Pseudomonadota bacterium]